MASAKTRFLHVANGTSTTRTIAAAGIPGACSIWADPLHEGPVPDVGDEELLEIRRRFLAGGADLTWIAWVGSDPTDDPADDLREWRAAIQRHHLYDEVILWFEHDLFDQLNLIQLLTWVGDRLPSTIAVSLICIGSFPGRPHFKGLGELTPDELAPLLHTRQPVTDAHYRVARGAWQAFRQATPVALDELRTADTSPLPYLAAAIGRFLEEYPWTRDGLSRTERRLLQLAEGDGIALWEAFPSMHVGEQAYYVTDTSVAGMAEALSRTSPPLLTLDISGAQERHALRGRITLTDAGRSVLAGHVDRVATCGLDRWFGGVHVHGAHAHWRWDDARQRIVRVEDV